jgi:hypothetical protein
MDVYNYDNLTANTLTISGYTIAPYGDIVSNGSPISVLDAFNDGVTLQKYVNGVPVVSKYKLKATPGINGMRAVAMVGQSNERGSARTWEGPGTVAWTTAFNVNGLTDPIAPAVTALGSVIPLLDDFLSQRGWNIKWANCAIGGSSFIKQWTGQVGQWSASTAYFGQRASIGTGDSGDYGDVILVGTRVFRCTTGRARYACNNSGVAIPSGGGAINIDYIIPVGSQVTGATQPSTMSTAALNDVIPDNTVTWTCIATSVGALTLFKPLASGEFGFDPLGLLARTKAALDAIPFVRERWVFMANGQSDAQGALVSQPTVRGWYAVAIRNMVNYFTAQGYKVALGFTCFSPNAAVFDDPVYVDTYRTLQLGISDAFASGFVTPANVIRGGDLYELWGRNVVTYPEPPATAISGSNAPHVQASQYPAFAKEWFNKLTSSGAW